MTFANWKSGSAGGKSATQDARTRRGVRERAGDRTVYPVGGNSEGAPEG